MLFVFILFIERSIFGDCRASFAEIAKNLTVYASFYFINCGFEVYEILKALKN